MCCFAGMSIPPAANEQMAPGQMMHQMVFGFNGSPPASPTKGYLSFTTMHMGMPPQGSPPQVPAQAPPHMQMYGQMFSAPGNQMPNLMAIQMGQHNTMMQPEYQIQQPFVRTPPPPLFLPYLVTIPKEDQNGAFGRDEIPLELAAF